MRRALVLVLFLVAACVPASSAPPVAVARIVHHLPTTAMHFPLPLVRGSVGGRKTIMIVDTGAQVSVVGTSLAVEAKLVVGPRVESLDPAGNPVTMSRADNVTITIDGLGAMPPAAIGVVVLPAVFDKLGIGAIIAPQTFATREHPIRVDLRHSKLTRTTPDALRAPSGLPSARVCRNDRDGFSARILVAEGVVDGVKTTLEIDTGADTLSVVADSEAGRKVSARTNGRTENATSASTEEIVVRKFLDVPIALGGWATENDVYVMPGHRHSSCGYDGRLSIQELAACAIVIAPDAVLVTCER